MTIYILKFSRVRRLQREAGPGRRRGAAQDGGHPAAAVVDALGQRAAVHAQLQVLALLVGHGQRLGHAQRQRQVAAQLAHEHGGADVARVHLHGAAALALPHHQALGVAVAAARAAVHEGRRQVVAHRLVHLLLRARAVGLEDDGHLRGSTAPSAAGHLGFPNCSRNPPPGRLLAGPTSSGSQGTRASGSPKLGAVAPRKDHNVLRCGLLSGTEVMAF
uniref:Uncharacterized protein n=3 Tax=Canis lupus TaxID=9612 RepID=A0A8C0SPY2_CANLF